jgi:tungstate transport system substrate-binding protein
LALLVGGVMTGCDRGGPDGQAKTGEVLTLATTTSTENSGLLAYLHPEFEKATGIQIKVIAKGTGTSLELAREGKADVILVHAKDKEEQFVKNGYGVERHFVMYNDFVLIGPASDPAGVKGTATIAEAMNAIAAAKATFISRGDSSGTHFKEQAIWQTTGLPLVEETRDIVAKGQTRTVTMRRPAGDWYTPIGQGMGRTLSTATDMQAYALADRGTYYAYSLGEEPRTDLVILSAGDEDLMNPYGVIAVNPEKFPNVKAELATKYVTWLISDETQKHIGDYRVGGRALFHPAR